MTAISSDIRPPLSTRATVLLGCGYLIAVAVLVSAAPLVPRATELFATGLPPRPYFVSDHALLLYAGVPAAVLASVAVFASPGLFLVLAFTRTPRASVLVLRAGVVALAVHVAGLAALHALIPGPPTRAALTAVLASAGGVAWVALLLRVRYRTADSLPRDQPGDVALLIWTGVIPLLLTWFLLPALLWQDFNPDGLEILTIGRSLSEWIIPRGPTGEATGLGLGMVTTAYPVSWFITLFGPIEAAARLPLVLYAPMVLAGIVAVAEVGRPRRLAAAEVSAIVVAVAAFVVALGYNDTYHVYSADIASPANIDIAAVALILGMIYALFAGDRRWLVAFTVLAYLTRPTPVMILGLMGMAIVLVDRKDATRRRSGLVGVGIALAVCAVMLVTFERFFATVADVRFDESSEQIAGRLRYLRFDDFGRFLYVIVPSGILPALSLLAYRRLDPLGRTLAVVTICYFGFFFVLAFHVLHHFAPAMVLPVIIYWRLLLNDRPRPAMIATTAALAGVALVLSLPRSRVVDRTEREIGLQTAYQIGDYRGAYDAWRIAFSGKDLFDTLFPPYWRARDPARERMGSPWVAVHYAHRDIGPETNYVIRPARGGGAPPPGFTLLRGTDTGAVYVRDLDRWHRDRYRAFDVHFRSALYDIPRESMLRVWGVPARRYTIDLRALLERLRGPPHASAGRRQLGEDTS